MKKRVLFLMYPAIGHFHAVFFLAKQIRDTGADVFFAGPEIHDKYISSQGFTYLILKSYPFGSGFERKSYEQSDDPFLDELLDRITYRYCNSRIKELSQLVDTLGPSVIFIDSFISTDFIAVQPSIISKHCKIYFVQTMLSTRPNTSALPLNVFLTTRSSLGISYFRFIAHLSAKINAVLGWIMFLGHDDLSQLKRLFKKLKVGHCHQIDANRTFRVGFSGIQEIVLAPSQLEYCYIPIFDQSYIGLAVDVDRKEHMSNTYRENLNVINEVKTLGGKIIYCSFGTQYGKFGKQVEGFIKKLINIAMCRKDLFFMVSYDKYFVEQASLPSNFFMEDPMPQLDILQYCDIMISHGGLNSIKEAIYHEVPILVYPLDYKWDQPGNATSINQKEIGLIGKMQKDSERDIVQKIDSLLQPSSPFKTKMTAFSQSISDQSKIRPILEEILRDEESLAEAPSARF